MKVQEKQSCSQPFTDARGMRVWSWSPRGRRQEETGGNWRANEVQETLKLDLSAVGQCKES